MSQHSELAKAYALNQWQALTYYAEDGWVEADNNITENAVFWPLQKFKQCETRLINIPQALFTGSVLIVGYSSHALVPESIELLTERLK